MKLPLAVVSIGVALFLAAVSALALVEVRQGAEPAQAVDSGGVDKMSIDMDPAGTPANTPTSIGTTESCAVINENGVLDADEDAVDALNLDVVVGPLGVPASNPMVFYAYVLNYSAANLRVTAQDQNFLLHESGGPYVSVSDPTPDSDGVFHAGELDNDFSATETGPGVLSRVTIESLETATPGAYDLTLTNAVTSDPSTEAFPADAVGDAVVVVGPLAVPDPCGDDDGDGIINAQDNCPALFTPWIVPPGDDDCDGWTTSLENTIGTLWDVHCATTPARDDEPLDASPPDFNDDQLVDISDVNTMRPPVFNLLEGKGTNASYSKRFDLNADDFINIVDVNAMRPPIFNVLVPCTP